MAKSDVETFSEFVKSLAAIPKMIVLDIGRRFYIEHHLSAVNETFLLRFKTTHYGHFMSIPT